MESAERLAANEAFFRQVNEEIERAARAQPEGSGAHVYAFLCECSDADCAERVELTLAEYEGVRADARRFVVVPGHQRGDVERVVARDDAHAVVEKLGRAGEVAVRTDPRAA